AGYQGVGQEITEQVQIEQTNTLLNETLIGERGPAYLKGALAGVASFLRAGAAFIAETDPASPDRLRTTFAFDGDAEAANYVYPIEGSPCAAAMAAEQAVLFQPNIRRDFPDDARFRDTTFTAYAASRLVDRSGAPFGVVALLRERPFRFPMAMRSILGSLALRIVAERVRSRAEDTVAASDARFRAFFDNLPGQAYIKNTDLRYEWVNQTFNAFSGRPLESFLGRRVTEAVPDSDGAAELERKDREVIETGKVVDSVVNVANLAGRDAWLRAVKFPNRLQTGETIGVGGINLDVTDLVAAEAARDEAIATLERRVAERTSALEKEVADRRRIETEIRKSESRLREVLEDSPMGVSIIVDKPFKRLFHNHRMTDLIVGDSEMDIEEVPGSQTFVRPEDYRLFFERTSTGRRIQSMQFARKRPNGEIWHSLVDAGPIRYEGQDAVIVWLYDITARVQTEQALEQSERRTREILDSSTAGISILRQHSEERIFINRRLADIYGAKSLEDLIAFGFDATIVRREDWLRARSLIERDGGFDQFLVERRRLDGTTCWLMVDARTIEFEGEPATIFWHYDITAQKRIEDDLRDTLDRLRLAQQELIQSERLASLGGMFAGMAHEINTPLGVALTATSLMEQQATEVRRLVEQNELTREKFDGFVATVAEGAHFATANLGQAARMVGGFKQVAVDRSTEARRRVRLAPYVEEVIASLRPALKGRPIAVSVVGDRALEADVAAGALSQIVSNLIMNALMHAFPAGASGRIEIAVEREGPMARLRYRDDGVGMTPEVLKRAFEPFFTTKRAQGGSGLGMSIIYNLATGALHGAIKCQSSPGEGVRIDIEFPVAPAADASPDDRAPDGRPVAS
ncbi:MAG: PAS domain S-box protein, partial [Alphaproteobacteria bacterium]